MKWFQHSTYDDDGPFITGLLEQFGHEGYAVFYLIKGVVAKNLEHQLDAFEQGQVDVLRASAEIDLGWLSKKCLSTPARIAEIAAYVAGPNGGKRFTKAKVSRNKEQLTVEIPSLIHQGDAYFAKRIGKALKKRGLRKDALAEVLGGGDRTRESVRPRKKVTPHKAEQSRAEERRAEDKKAAAGAEAPGADVAGSEVASSTPSPDAAPSPPPPPPAAAAAAAARPPANGTAGGTDGDPLGKEDMGVALLLLLPLGLTDEQVRTLAKGIPLREIAVVVGEAREPKVQNPGAYASNLLKHRYRRSTGVLTRDMEAKVRKYLEGDQAQAEAARQLSAQKLTTDLVRKFSAVPGGKGPRPGRAGR